jgi:hypothetical protein
MTTWTPTVPRIVDGTPVAAATVNPPIDALVNRTQYLYDLVSGPARSALVATNQPVAPGAGLSAGAVVYYDGTNSPAGLRLASPRLADLAGYPFFRGADSTHVFGIVRQLNSGGNSGNAEVWLQGLIRQTGLVQALLDIPDASFRSGPLYLSGRQDGKLTPQPNGLAIFVGYACNPDEFLLAPGTESLAELFWNFRFDILDRPAGTASVAPDGVWGITSVDLDKVGWIPATSRLTQGQLDELFVGLGTPAYFYNVPAPGVVDSANPELSEAERSAAKSFQAALPARPNAFMFLTVNGVVHTPRMAAEDRGIFVLNELGLWWYRDAHDPVLDTGEFTQPWSAEFDADGSGPDPGQGPSFWGASGPSETSRPRISLQFTKINPDVRQNLVTSLRGNPAAAAPAIRVLGRSTGDPAITGDLLLQLDFGVVNLSGDAGLNGGRAVKWLAYDPVTERLQATMGDVVSGLQGGAGVTVTRGSDGTYLIQQSSGLGGAIAVIEPEQSRLEFFGLNSMLVMEASASNPSGFYGKFTLPGTLAAGVNGLRLVFTLAGKVNATAGAATTYFRLEHAVSPTGRAMSQASTIVPQVSFPLVTSGSYVAMTPVRTPSTGVPAANVPDLFIPRTALEPGATVNFRITRLQPSGAAALYSGAVGLIEAGWTLV